MTWILLGPLMCITCVQVRAVDHLSWSPGTQRDAGAEARPSKKARKEMSVNGYTMPTEKMKHDTLDVLAVTMRHYVQVVGVIPGLVKVSLHALLCNNSNSLYNRAVQADIDAAFRRIPVAPQHRWACWVAFIVMGQVSLWLVCQSCVLCVQCQVFVSQHASCPFGAVASVHAWERVGAAITHIARKFLKLAVLRYVDDMFAPERCSPCFRRVSVCVIPDRGVRPETMEHALQCLARLIRVLLGPTAVALNKLACGRTLDVLGVWLF
jgi:hypothetical protein